MDNQTLHDDLVERLDRIQVKVEETNGRVKQLELWRAGVKGFLGGIAIVASLPGVVMVVIQLTGS